MPTSLLVRYIYRSFAALDECSCHLQIALGVASYGHSFHVDNAAFKTSKSTSMASYPPFDKSRQPHGDNADDAAGVDQCGNPVGVGGVFDFRGLIENGFLTDNGTQASGIDYIFDECSQTVGLEHTSN
jgi:chitinase